MITEAHLTVLKGALGRRLVRAWRVFYEHNGSIATDSGPLELELDDGFVILLKGAGDGERLTVAAERWADPFVGPLSRENAQFVRQSGKWVRVEASLSNLQFPLGKRLSHMRLLKNRFGTEAGVAFDFEGEWVRFLVECDDDYVMSLDDERFLEWGFVEGDYVSAT